MTGRATPQALAALVVMAVLTGCSDDAGVGARPEQSKTSSAPDPSETSRPSESASPADSKMQRAAYCRDFRERVSASYRVWWRWTDTGKAWWIEMTIDNRTGGRLGGGTGGAVRVTGLLEDGEGWNLAASAVGPGRSSIEHWGGSSADTLDQPPGVSRVFIAPVVDPDVHTTADGTFEIVDFQLYLLVPDGPACTVPIPEKS